MGETEWLTRKEAAAYLGISLRTLDYWAARGQVRCYKRGRVVRYLRKHLDEAMGQQDARETVEQRGLLGRFRRASR